MSSNLSKIEYNGWAGGLNVLVDRTKTQKDQLREATNVRILPNGEIASRPSLSQAGFDLEANRIYSLFSVNALPLVRHGKDKKIATSTAVTLKTYATDSRGQFEFFNSTMLHTNGADTMQQWDGAAATTSDVAGAPVSRILLKHNDRVFAATGSVLYETAVNTAIDWAGGAAWNVGLGEGGNINGIGEIGEDLFIFKQDRIYRMSGYSASERQIILFVKNFGTVAPDTIKTVYLLGIGECLVFLDSQKRICALNLSGCWNIGECVQPLLDTLYSTGTYANLTMPTAHACVTQKYKQYLLAFSDTADPTLEKNVLVLHFDSPYKSSFGTRWGFTKYRESYSASFSIAYQAFHESTGFGLMVGIAIDEIALYSAARMIEGIFDYINTASATPQYPVVSTVQTRDEDAGNSDSVKQWRRALMRTSLSLGVGSVSQTNMIEYTDETVTAKTEAQPMTSTGAFASVFDTWMDLVNSAKTVSLKLVFNFLAAPNDPLLMRFKLSYLSIFYKKSQIENRK
jgi:hypothetical protein